ncbi:hypothetical protein [Thauera humireducens]|uniref:hypothetical protein n=1 Tax=Thauera humireducens TaxID=1134435 RepID=UPI00311E256E
MRIGTARSSYRHDESLFDSRTQHAWLAVLAVALLGFPSWPTSTGCTSPAWWRSTSPAPPDSTSSPATPGW